MGSLGMGHVLRLQIAFAIICSMSFVRGTPDPPSMERNSY